MISGIEFNKYCKWNLCNRYPINFNKNEIKENDFIFINLDNITQFINFLDDNKLDYKFNLITHNSDTSFNEEMFNRISKYINKIYAINCVVKNDTVYKIPLGFSDRLIPVISNINKKETKNNLLYLNFNIHSGRIPERINCFNTFKDLDWVKIENNITEIDYYNSLNNSKYSLCPIGAGLDTHRFYESIYFGTIPIIIKNDISDLHKKFPCIIINNWNEINKEFLENNYEKYYNYYLDWINKNKNWTKIENWISNGKSS